VRGVQPSVPRIKISDRGAVQRGFPRLRRVLDLRLFRASLIPFVAMLAIVAFSVHPLPAPLTSGIPPAASTRARVQRTGAPRGALSEAPHRSPADRALGSLIASRLAGDGYAVRTAGGAVLATQPGPGGARSSCRRSLWRRRAALSGTAALLELAGTWPRGEICAAHARLYDGTTVPRFAGRSLRRSCSANLAGTGARHPFEIRSRTMDRPRRSRSSRRSRTGCRELWPPRCARSACRVRASVRVTAQAPLLDAGIPAVLAQQSGESGPRPTSR